MDKQEYHPSSDPKVPMSKLIGKERELREIFKCLYWCRSDNCKGELNCHWRDDK